METQVIAPAVAAPMQATEGRPAFVETFNLLTITTQTINNIRGGIYQQNKKIVRKADGTEGYKYTVTIPRHNQERSWFEFVEAFGSRKVENPEAFTHVSRPANSDTWILWREETGGFKRVDTKFALIGDEDAL